MAWENGQSPHYSAEKNAEIAAKNKATADAQAAAHKADAEKKGLIDSSGNYKTDELDRTYNTSTGKWEAGPNTPTARTGYSNEGGAKSGGSSGGAITGKAGAITGGGTVKVDDNSKYYQEMLRRQEESAAAMKAQNEAAQRAALDAAVGKMEGSRTNINSGYDDLLYQQAIERRQNERKLPQLLAAQGYNGGMTESSGLKMESAYQNLLQNAEKARIGDLASLDSSIAELRATGELSIANQSSLIEQNALNNYMQIMQAAVADKRWAAELGISQQQAANQLSWAQQQFAAQQAMAQQQFDWQKQTYADSLSGSNANNALNLANTLAGYGDFSGLGALGGNADLMTKYYQQLIANKTKSGGSSGSSGGAATKTAFSGSDNGLTADEEYWYKLLFGGSYGNSM